MKTVICLSFVLAVAVACNVEPSPASQSSLIPSSEKLAKGVITALQHESAEEYFALFPTLQEFHQVMDDNADFYGKSLSEAKEEFAAVYERNLTRSVQESFDRIVRQGRNSGIVWNTIRFERIDNTGQTEQFAQASLVISFTANGKQQRLILKKALILNSQWKVSQFIELV